MRATGTVRHIDNLGRVVLPIELRRTYDMNEGDGVEIYTDEDKIILKKYQPACIFCDSTDGVKTFKGKKVCSDCRKELRGDKL